MNRHNITAVAIATTLTLLVIIAMQAERIIADNTSMRSAPNDCQKVLSSQVDAWNRRDLDGFMQGYFNSEDLEFFSDNTVSRGYDNLKQRYHQRYQAEGKEMGKLTFSELNIQPASPRVATVRGRWQVEMKNDTSRGLFTLIMHKTPSGWKIVHDHTSAEKK